MKKLIREIKKFVFEKIYCFGVANLLIFFVGVLAFIIVIMIDIACAIADFARLHQSLISVLGRFSPIAIVFSFLFSILSAYVTLKLDGEPISSCQKCKFYSNETPYLKCAVNPTLPPECKNFEHYERRK